MLGAARSQLLQAATLTKRLVLGISGRAQRYRPRGGLHLRVRSVAELWKLVAMRLVARSARIIGLAGYLGAAVLMFVAILVDGVYAPPANEVVTDQVLVTSALANGLGALLGPGLRATRTFGLPVAAAIIDCLLLVPSDALGGFRPVPGLIMATAVVAQAAWWLSDRRMPFRDGSSVGSEGDRARPDDRLLSRAPRRSVMRRVMPTLGVAAFLAGAAFWPIVALQSDDLTARTSALSAFEVGYCILAVALNLVGADVSATRGWPPAAMLAIVANATALSTESPLGVMPPGPILVLIALLVLQVSWAVVAVRESSMVREYDARRD
jgi:hypothetical protein